VFCGCGKKRKGIASCFDPKTISRPHDEALRGQPHLRKLKFRFEDNQHKEDLAKGKQSLPFAMLTRSRAPPMIRVRARIAHLSACQPATVLPQLKDGAAGRWEGQTP
jgi:hypothetical protein